VGTNIIPFYAVGIDEEEAKGLNTVIYPNPTSDQISLKLTESASVRIVNMNGKVVGQHQLTAADNRISVSNLAIGEYMIINSKGELLGQFIKQ
jgi:hypothetical protein